VRERLGDPRVVPSFRCTFLPGMPSSPTPGSSNIATCPVSRCRHGLRRELTGSTLPILPQSDSRGRSISWLHWFAIATACQVACPPGRIRLGYFPSHRGLLLPGFRRVGRPSRRPGSYRGVPTAPRTGLSPAASTCLSRHTHNAVIPHSAFHGQTPDEISAQAPPSRSTSPSPAVSPATLGSTETAPSTAAPAFLISRRALTRIREAQ